MANSRADVRTFSCKTLVGNWFEDVQLEEDAMKEFWERKENGKLLSAQASRNASADPSQKPGYMTVSTDGVLHIGDSIQLRNVGSDPVIVMLGKQSERQAATLCVAPQNPLAPQPESGASASHQLTPGARNVFKVASCDGSPQGRPVLYGEPFQLACCDGAGGVFLLASDAKSLARAAKKSGNNEVFFTSDSSYLTQWRAEFINPQCRLEFEGSPVKVNERLLIKHMKTNESLALESKHTSKNICGIEYEVSGRTYLDDHKAERDVNQWMFATKIPQGANCNIPEPTAEPTTGAVVTFAAETEVFPATPTGCPQQQNGCSNTVCDN